MFKIIFRLVIVSSLACAFPIWSPPLSSTTSSSITITPSRIIVRNTSSSPHNEELSFDNDKISIHSNHKHQRLHNNNHLQQQQQQQQQQQRRRFLCFMGTCMTTTLSLTPSISIPSSSSSSFYSSSNSIANAEILRSPGKCANGVGDGCNDLADGNALVRSLQEKSLANREKNQRESLYAYYMKNYPDVFNVYDKKMVMKSDGTSFALYSPEEVKDMLEQGKIKIEYPMSKGGRIVDLTQKPILVLIGE